MSEANLLLFKTVIAGDSWGRIAVPVIEILGPETSGPIGATGFGELPGTGSGRKWCAGGSVELK